MPLEPYNMRVSGDPDVLAARGVKMSEEMAARFATGLKTIGVSENQVEQVENPVLRKVMRNVLALDTGHACYQDQSPSSSFPDVTDQ